MKIFVMICTVALCFGSCNKTEEVDVIPLTGTYEGTLTTVVDPYDFSTLEEPFEPNHTVTEEVITREAYCINDTIYIQGVNPHFALHINELRDNKLASSEGEGNSSSSFVLGEGELYIDNHKGGGSSAYPYSIDKTFVGKRID